MFELDRSLYFFVFPLSHSLQILPAEFGLDVNPYDRQCREWCPEAGPIPAVVEASDLAMNRSSDEEVAKHVIAL